MIKTFKKGGIHPKADKLTAKTAIKPLPTPATIRLMLSQSIGAPAKAIVKSGDYVTMGQLVAEPGSFVSAAIHSPVAGTVKKIESTRNPRGLWQESILIETDPDAVHEIKTTPRSEVEIEALSSKDLIRIIAEAGIVGLGGAAFPTHVKLSIPEGKHADYILINGAECEPFLTCDDVLMKESADTIISGTRLLMKASGAARGIIGIEENKPEAIERMREAARPHDDISVVILRKKYPQGSEKQLIEALTGRRVPPGALPIDVNVIVDNVATANAVYDAVYLRIPLIRRVVTITGPLLDAGGNFLAPNGVSIKDLIDFAGGLPEDTGKVISGGPMMGQAVADLDAPIVKATGGITILPENMSQRKDSGPCIRCARCVSACPMGLEPYLLILQSQRSYWEETRKHSAMACLECGCCSYICPAHRPLLDYIKLAKSHIRTLKQ
ncbi:MAG: electron transport complex subunit RsxC [Prevotella sp.]|nr:electron transport complex subunit RsxC [Bacteroides sp.]MCM1366129.1 electron transport complex subunit RsxC [Prevotella sp.]MCM1436806.1 electron transport complex subunit RsxC [Prevotella sp.]